MNALATILRDVRFVPNSKGLPVIVDEADWELLREYTWTVIVRRDRNYVCTNKKVGPNKYIRHCLSRLIMQPDDGFHVDHINGDPLDNRRTNLRACTPQQNSWNRRKASGKTSIYKGVSLITPPHRYRFPWRAVVWLPAGKMKVLGTYETEVSAARAYDDAVRELHGEFACLNFPVDGEQHTLRHLKPSAELAA